MSQFRPLLTLNVTAATALTGERFVTKAGGVPAAAAKGFGVLRGDTVSGAVGPVDVLGTAICAAGAAVADDANLELDASGRVVTLAAGVKVGKALMAASAIGDRIEILLTP